MGQFGVYPPVGPNGWSAGGARTQCFPLQEGMNHTTLQNKDFKCKVRERTFYAQECLAWDAPI